MRGEPSWRMLFTAWWWLADFRFYECLLYVMLRLGFAYNGRPVLSVVKRYSLAYYCLRMLRDGENPADYKLVVDVTDSKRVEK